MKRFLLLSLLAVVVSPLAWSQKLETSSDFTTGYHDGMYYSADDVFYTSVDGVLYAIGYNNTSDRWTLVKYPASKTETTYTVHPKCYRIGRGAFEGARNLVTINIPGRVRYIGDNAFDGCTSLKAINYGEAASQIGQVEHDAPTDGEPQEIGRYNMAGQPVGPAEKGVQIVVYSDFTARTLLVE